MSIITYYNGTNLKHEEFSAEVENSLGQLVRHGQYTKYWRNQRKAAEGFLTVGKRHGEWKFWYDFGVLESVNTYADGALSGPTTRYHMNGLPATSGECHNNFAIGLWQSWYQNGKLESVGNYAAGHRVGEWKFYDDSANLISTIDYGV